MASGRTALLIGCGCLLALLLAVAVLFAGCGGLMFAGMEMVEDQVEADLRSNEVIRERLGGIEEFELDWGASFQAPGEDVFVFRIRGPRGAGTVWAHCVTVSADEEDVDTGYLRLSTGEVYDLTTGRRP